MANLDLRPLSLGEILDRTFSIYRRNFLLFVGITAIPQLLVLALQLGQVFVTTSSGLRKTPPGNVLALGAIGVLTFLIGIIVYLVAYLFAHGGTVHAVSELYLGRTASIGDSLRWMRGKALGLFGVSFLNGLAAGFAFLCLIVPGIYVGCRLMTCVPAALLEDLGARDSLERSWSLTKDNAGRAFVIFLLYFALLYGALLLFSFPFLIAIPFSAKDPGMIRIWMACSQIGNFAAAILVTPIFTIASTVFYYDLRVQKEAFDLQLMMNPQGNIVPAASGVPTLLS